MFQNFKREYIKHNEYLLFHSRECAVHQQSEISPKYYKSIEPLLEIYQ